MSFIPHTQSDTSGMLAALELEEIDQLFETIPPELKIDRLPPGLPDRHSEPELVAKFEELSDDSGSDLVCFAGAGAYDSYIAAAVEDLASRPEFATAYTPYQPEVSQGVLQALFEYQTLICRLTGTEVSNASLYDGGTALVEAANLAHAATGSSRFLVSSGVNPRYREVLTAFGAGPGYRFDQLELLDGVTVPPDPSEADVAAIIVQNPNYLGSLETLDHFAHAARRNGALLIVVTDPVALGLLKRPGDQGADVVVGEGQQLGNPLAFGGPYLGFLATGVEYLRLVPGRISGETVDRDGRRAYTLALQGREQHIRREKASSNICTNQTLNAIAAAIALCWLGPRGLRRVAELATRKAHYLADSLEERAGAQLAVPSPFFREFPVRLPIPASDFLARVAELGYLGGVDLSVAYPELGDAILVGVSEKRTRDEIDGYVEAFMKAVD